jgi:hypothetical protein
MVNGEKRFRLFTIYDSPFTALLRLFVSRVLAATAAEFPKLQALRGRLLILRRHVVATFAVRALKHNIIARHKSPFKN